MRSVSLIQKSLLQKEKAENKNNIYRLAATTSASSKKIILGAARRALRNVLRNKASPSPTYIEKSSAPLKN